MWDDEDEDELERIQTALERIGQQISGDDARILEAAGEQLEWFETIRGALRDTREALAQIDDQYDLDLRSCPEQRSALQLGSAAMALKAICDFGYLRSRAVTHLLKTLADLVAGGPPHPMFRPWAVGPGRRADLPRVQQVKGMLAGLMHAKQLEGMKRLEAAAFIAEGISPNLAMRISKKPITPRMVEEWLDRYGGAHPPDDAGGEMFKSYKDGTRR